MNQLAGRLALCVACFFGASAARAEIGTLDAVPAATLLLPYFEVALDDREGVNTVLSINNASAAAVLAHVVVWSDLSVPVLDFNIYLTGYDVQQMSMRDVLNGRLPMTASDGQDPTDAISPQGGFSQDINFQSCSGQLPIPPLDGIYVSHLYNSLTGVSSPLLGGLCAGRRLGDQIARGYVTIDVVNNCALLFPPDPGYFVNGGLGTATNQNVLWGDVIRVDPAGNFASAETLVHIEADATNPETSVPGEYTFYGRYVFWNAADNREPLSTRFAVRYLDGGAFDGGADLITWRDSKVNQIAFPCNQRPSWFPLSQSQIVIWDEEENPEVPTGSPVSPQPPSNVLLPFPAEAQRTEVGGSTLPVSASFGWFFLDLNTFVTPAGPTPPEDPQAAQAWVSVEMSAEGRYSVGFPAIQLDSAASTSHAPIGN
jgi:hypothetical protein